MSHPPVRRPRRWLRSAALPLTLLALFAIGPALGADSSPTINPLGITFDYKLAWINVEESTFGVKMQATAHGTTSTDPDPADWSLLLRYAPDAQANITAVSKGWGLGVYDYASWALLPSKTPYDYMYFTVHTSGDMSLEDTVVNHAEPKTLILVPESRPNQDSTGYSLIKDRDYTINAGVNLAEIPKDAFGNWLSLVDTNAESVLDVAREPGSSSDTHSSPTSSVASSSSAGSGITLINAVAEIPTQSGIDIESPSPSPSEKVSNDGNGKGENADAAETVLPPVKFIKGDPNYDPTTDPIGTMLGAPKIGLYLVNSILGVGVVAHLLGTVRRYQYRRQYQMSVKRSTSGHSFA
ncbi:hypothetical protein LPJ63_003041 [Coemansia sp. RSA 2711]|nr:hypothetical protein LPJ63_003041 [Coemansia sp. RSA 2711]KAJ2376288.1 hypothetical protein H4S02_007963 [Coemansia sp. RSA 2611]